MHKLLSDTRQYLRETDTVILFFSIASGAMGFIFIYSATMYLGSLRNLVVQGLGILLGIAGMILISKLDFEHLAEFSKYLFVLNILGLALVLLIGRGEGNTNWIKVGPINVQPSEFIKLTFIITFATHLNRVKDEINSPRNVLFLLLHFAPIALLIALQGDFGTLLVYFVIVFCMCYVAGLHLLYFVGAGGIGLLSAPLIWNHVLSDYHRKRLLIGFNPELDPTKYGYQVLQSKMAIGSGQFWGRGLFHGPMIQEGGLVMKYPDEPNRPDQAYTARETVIL